MAFDHRLHPLNPIEARVLATLMEKARTVPDSYPLSLNTLVTGCNQKSSRDPVMQLTEPEAQDALDSLRLRSLVFESSSGRTTRWEHNFERVLNVPSQSSALLGLLMLRGPQTAGELRIHTERWHRFADISSVEAFLTELAERSEEKGGPLVMLLPRAPGARESRWAHLLCGTPELTAAAASTEEGRSLPAQASTTAMASRVSALEAQVKALQAQMAALCEALGVEIPDAHLAIDEDTVRMDSSSERD